jgi:tetratricopeptide (TPR) repeat protein
MSHSATARWAAAFVVFAFAGFAQAPPPDWVKARELYQDTDYQGSLAVLLRTSISGARVLQLIGQNHYMLGDYKKASDILERAATANPTSSECAMWLGRAFGRRAETSNPLMAPGYASKARQWLEKAVELDPNNRDATGDLFDYYMEAPSFLGGGESKAQELADRVAQRDPAEGHYYQAQISDKHRQYGDAEKHLRAAVASTHLAARQVGHWLDLAKFLAHRGRTNESEAAFDKASELSPSDPRILFARAQIYVQQSRNLDQARDLLEQYLKSPLTPNYPSRRQAEALLKKIGA